jgi:Flp pilus assembly pilin Flp
MAINLTITNIFQFISALTPLLLIFFMVMISVFNQDLKGMVYLAGILIVSVINILLLNIIKNKRYEYSGDSCNIFNLPFNMTNYNVPSLNSVLISFTVAYLLLPMIASKQMNYALIAALLSIFVIDGITKIMNKCTTIAGVILGLFTGLLSGSLWYTLFHSTGYNSLLYFDQVVSNKVYCSRPKKQTFKCSVYKNGELIKTL